MKKYAIISVLCFVLGWTVHGLSIKHEHNALVAEVEKKYDLTCNVVGKAPVAASSSIRMSNCVIIVNKYWYEEGKHVMYIGNQNSSEFTNLVFLTLDRLSTEGLQALDHARTNNDYK